MVLQVRNPVQDRGYREGYDRSDKQDQEDRNNGIGCQTCKVKAISQDPEYERMHEKRTKAVIGEKADNMLCPFTQSQAGENSFDCSEDKDASKGNVQVEISEEYLTCLSASMRDPGCQVYRRDKSNNPGNGS